MADAEQGPERGQRARGSGDASITQVGGDQHIHHPGRAGWVFASVVGVAVIALGVALVVAWPFDSGASGGHAASAGGAVTGTPAPTPTETGSGVSAPPSDSAPDGGRDRGSDTDPGPPGPTGDVSPEPSAEPDRDDGTVGGGGEVQDPPEPAGSAEAAPPGDAAGPPAVTRPGTADCPVGALCVWERPNYHGKRYDFFGSNRSWDDWPIRDRDLSWHNNGERNLNACVWRDRDFKGPVKVIRPKTSSPSDHIHGGAGSSNSWGNC